MTRRVYHHPAVSQTFDIFHPRYGAEGATYWVARTNR